MTSIHEPEAWEVAGCFDPGHVITVALRSLASRSLALRDQHPVLSLRYEQELADAQQRWDDFYAQQRTAPGSIDEAPARGTGIVYDAPPVKQVPYIAALHELDTAAAMATNVGPMMLLDLVGGYDTFVGNLLRAAYKLRPELLKGSDRPLFYIDTLDLPDMDAVRALFVEREVDDLLHRSHAEQLTALARRIGLETLAKFAEFDDFVELTERRNLFAHTGGRASAHYLNKAGSSANAVPCRPGDVIGVDRDYFRKAAETILVVGTLLAHTLWRKIAPDQRGAADKDLAQMTYAFLAREEWQLAQRLLSFAVNLNKYSSDAHRLVFQINLAQTHKWLGNQKACENILQGEDWGARDFALQLSVAVLHDDYASAGSLMTSAAATNQVRRRAFDHWPIYREFRQTPEFRDAYIRSYNADPWPAPEAGAA